MEIQGVAGNIWDIRSHNHMAVVQAYLSPCIAR